MDDVEVHMEYCRKCIDDHENRLRAIERNNKLELRVEILEKYMSGQISTGMFRKDITALLVALVALALSALGFYLEVF